MVACTIPDLDLAVYRLWTSSSHPCVTASSIIWYPPKAGEAITAAGKVTASAWRRIMAVYTAGFITLRAKLNGAVYCNRSSIWVCVFVYVFVGLLPR